MLRVRIPDEKLIIENDEAIFTIFLKWAADSIEALGKEKVPFSTNGHARPIEDAMSRAAEGWITHITQIAKEVNALPDSDFQRICAQISNRIADDFVKAFNHLILLRRYMLLAKKNDASTSEGRDDGWAGNEHAYKARQK
jgi:hypothetical protein